jgi:hypothetical protein
MGPVEAGYLNKGYKKRQGMFKEKEVPNHWKKVPVSFIGHLDTDFDSADNGIINRVGVTIKMTRAEAPFYILSSSPVDVILKLSNIQLHVHSMVMEPRIFHGITEKLKDKEAVYNYRRTIVLCQSIPLNTVQFKIDNVFQGNNPAKALWVVSETTAMSGDYSLNPFSFRRSWPHKQNDDSITSHCPRHSITEDQFSELVNQREQRREQFSRDLAAFNFRVQNRQQASSRDRFQQQCEMERRHEEADRDRLEESDRRQGEYEQRERERMDHERARLEAWSVQHQAWTEAERVHVLAEAAQAAQRHQSQPNLSTQRPSIFNLWRRPSTAASDFEVLDPPAPQAPRPAPPPLPPPSLPTARSTPPPSIRLRPPSVDVRPTPRRAPSTQSVSSYPQSEDEAEIGPVFEDYVTDLPECSCGDVCDAAATPGKFEIQSFVFKQNGQAFGSLQDQEYKPSNCYAQYLQANTVLNVQGSNQSIGLSYQDYESDSHFYCVDLSSSG